MALAEHEVAQRWASYEEMATRGPARFPADARNESSMDVPEDTPLAAAPKGD